MIKLRAIKYLTLWAVIILVFGGVTARAQTSTYNNTATADIDATVACGTANITRIFTVPGSDDFFVGDLDIGFLASHTWRGDIRLDLSSPAGTSVNLIVSDTTAATMQDNYNIRLDDDGAVLVNNPPHDTNDGLVAPPYENLVMPDNGLSAFSGENSVGDWTLTICDDFPGADTGEFLRGELFFTHATDADLSLNISASDTTPNIGSNVQLVFTVFHAGALAADGISVDINLPAGLSYVFDTGGGDYNDITGLWSVPGPLLNSGANLTITAFVNPSGSFVTTAEILTSDQSDPDSVPGNGVTTEDDFDTLTVNPATPAVPSLFCPGAPSVLDWDSNPWPVGTLNNSYTVAGEPITIIITDPDTTLLNDPVFGGQTPALAINNTGGIVPGEQSLHFLRNPPTISSATTITLAVGSPGIGVSQFQLTLFDIDNGAGQFEDQITVTGSLSGSSVPVTLFTSTSNSASGNVVTGNAGSTPTQANGNMTLQFSASVDRVTIVYGNGSGAPADPGNQGIAIYDVNFCLPTAAVLSAQKTLTVFDPFAAGLYAVPGNDVIYSIVFTNSGNGPADNDSVVIIDSMPSEVEFFNGDIDDGGPLSDPVIGIDSGSALTFSFGSDARFFDGPIQPANFAACNYTPSAGYDPNVTFICLNPKGIMAAGAPDPSFEIQFRARIK